MRLLDSFFLNDQKGKSEGLLRTDCEKYCFISHRCSKMARLVFLSHFLNLSCGRSVHQSKRRMMSNIEIIV